MCFRILVKEVGHFVVVDVPDLGIQIYWDKGTRINLQVDQKWKNHVIRYTYILGIVIMTKTLFF